MLLNYVAEQFVNFQGCPGTRSDAQIHLILSAEILSEAVTVSPLGCILFEHRSGTI